MPWYEDKKKPGTYFFKVNYKENGKYEQILRRGFTSIKAVKAAMTEAENEVNKGTYLKSSKTLYRDFLTEWLNDKKTSVKTGTLAMYTALSKHILLKLDMEIQKITPRDIQNLYNYLFETGKMADENIQKCHSIINASLKQAKLWKVIAENPAELVKRPAARKKKMKYWSLEEAQQFLAAAKTDPLYIVFLLVLATGMRIGEVLGLLWENVDMKSQIISITQILEHDGKEFDDGAKTFSGERPIRLDEHTMKTLETYRVKQIEKRMEFANMFEDQGLVVCTRFGNPVIPRNVNRTFKRIVETLNRKLEKKRACGEETEPNLKKIRFHDLRHTHTTFLIKNRETPQAIAERLGWKSTRMIDKYAHIRPDIQVDVAEAFGKSFYLQ